jgi:hypothetical protein
MTDIGHFEPLHLIQLRKVTAEVNLNITVYHKNMTVGNRKI